MINQNFVIIAGNVVKDAELRYTKNQKPVTTFRVATNKYTQDGQQEAAQYHNIVCWIDAESYAGLMKGYFVVVTGELRTRKWKDSQNIERYITEIVAHTVTIAVEGNKKSNYDSMAASNLEEVIPF